VQELTSLMQALGATLDSDTPPVRPPLPEAGSRRRTQAHGEASHNRQLTEVTAIQPILDRIVADPSVMNVTAAAPSACCKRPAHINCLGKL